MAATFKALSALLAYPSAELQAAIGDIREVIRSEALVGRDASVALETLLDELSHADLFAMQERYVDLFDRTRRLSLHMFEHVHGESRDRGQAMIDLAALYRKGGLVLTAKELPDYLPLFLEYLSTRPLEEARGLLGDARHIFAVLEERLGKRGSAYAAVFAAIGGLAATGLPSEGAATADEVEAVDELAALDAAWEETAVVFGPGEALDGCSVDRLRMQVRAGARDARRATA